jgi:hypothetical protein
MASTKSTNKNTSKNNEAPKRASEEEMIKKSEVEETVIDPVEENNALKNEIETLKAQITLMMKTMAGNTNNVSSYEEDIPVISMCNWVLNLTTEPMGGGNIYKFTQFGEEQVIPRDDLKRIVKVNSKFIKEGLAYIADEEFVRKEKLISVYNKIVDVETMKKLLDADKVSFKKVFTSLSNTQKDVLIDLICKKLIKDEDVDMNIVHICEEISGRDLSEEVKQAKEILSEIKK